MVQGVGRGTSKPAVHVIFGLTRDGGFALAIAAGKRSSLAVHLTSRAEQALTQLARLARLLAEKKVLPIDLSSEAAGARAVRTPRCAALDMDTHVAKRTLIVGDAGGFVSAASGEGIYPAMWSANLAADVADDALNSPRPQDRLITYDSAWRMEMADYLRPPNTDLQLLLPLVFTNQAMCDRMGEAFFCGRNI